MSKVFLSRRSVCMVSAVASWICHAPASAFEASPHLNDTGMTRCAVFDDRKVQWVLTKKCEGSGQDPVYGRDAHDASDKDGRVGFAFVKIDEQGQKLPREAPNWRCVLDRTTGLVWEVKTSDGGLFDYRNRYTNVGDGRATDANTLVSAANAEGLCGGHDWRLPSRGELEGLLDYGQAGGGPMIDGRWFPNTLASLHWTETSSRVNGGGEGYWWATNFYSGDVIWRSGEFDANPVRLVRDGRQLADKRWKIGGADGSEVLDRHTSLIWRRCAEGRSWTGTTCTGPGTTVLTGPEATDHALAEAARTGKPWRVPNVKELSSLVATGTNFPAIDTRAFPAFEPDHYHSGTFWTQDPVYSWRVSFGRGEVLADHWGGRLLLVRDAP